MEGYKFEPFREALFAGLTAVGILAFEMLANFDITSVLADPKTYGVMAAGALARAFGAAGLNVLVRFVASRT